MKNKRKNGKEMIRRYPAIDKKSGMGGTGVAKLRDISKKTTSGAGVSVDVHT